MSRTIRLQSMWNDSRYRFTQKRREAFSFLWRNSYSNKRETAFFKTKEEWTRPSKPISPRLSDATSASPFLWVNSPSGHWSLRSTSTVPEHFGRFTALSVSGTRLIPLDAVKAWEQSVLTRKTTYSPISQPQLKAKIPLFLRNPKR